MYKGLGSIILTSGEQVEAGVVIGPDAEWSERIEKLLGHKGEPWNWQNSRALRNNDGIENRFYILHRRGIPFANISISELSGAGILAHVWTKPEDRGKGACSRLMNVQMEEFKSRLGKALFLFTEYNSVAYHIYQRFGFMSVEPLSGLMSWYSTTKDEFESIYFEKWDTEIQQLQWTHWPASPALFMGGNTGVIRCLPLDLVGRQSTQYPILHLLYNEKYQTMILQNKITTAVVGVAAWDWHPLWEDTCLVDIYCHPNYWDEANNLFGSLSLPDAYRYIAYCEVDFKEKVEVLLDKGFKQTVILKNWIPSNYAKESFLDVAMFEKIP